MTTSSISFPRMHASFYVSNLAESIHFYNAFFSQEPSKVKPGYAKYELQEPPLIISFIENPERVQADFGHLGFQVATEVDLEAMRQDMKAKNLVTLEEQGTNCCYARQDKFWATDPDGIQWEVYLFHEDAEFNDPKYAMEAEAACCTPLAETPPKEQALAVAEGACCVPGAESACC